MKTNKLIFLLATIAILSLAGCSQTSDPKITALATCLADNGIKEYGAFWCPNCAKQEKMFGNAYAIIKDREVYIECDPRCSVPKENLPVACNGIVGQTDLCLEKGVTKYPHWEFPNGDILLGVQELKTLADKAGCEYSEA